VEQGIKRGIHFPFSEISDKVAPHRARRRPRSSFSKESLAFMDKEVARLVEIGATRQLESEPLWLLDVFPAPKDTGGFRFILNGSVTKELWDMSEERFSVEGLNLVPETVREGDFMTVIDVRAAYFSAKLDEQSAFPLNFRWIGKDGVTRWFRFLVPPFGAAPSGAAFDKPMQTVFEHFRHEAHPFQRWKTGSLRYVDDAMLANRTVKTGLLATLTYVWTMVELGYVIAWNKGVWEPTQGEKASERLRFLGMFVCSVSRRFLIPPDKLEKFKRRVRWLLREGAPGGKGISKRAVARVTGLIYSFTVSCKPARAYAYELNEVLQARAAEGWDHLAPLPQQALEDLGVWLECIDEWSGSLQWKSDIPTTAAVFLEADGAGDGWGGGLVSSDVSQLSHFSDEEKRWAINFKPTAGLLSEEEISQSSTFRELTAAIGVIKTFAEEVRHRTVSLQMDSSGAVSYVNRGGGKVRKCRELARVLWRLCASLDTDLTAVWVPRSLNARADFWSKHAPVADMRLQPQWFGAVQKFFGVTFTIDRFASASNSLCTKFDSWVFEVGTSHVDTFTADWGDEKEINFFNPPFAAIPKALAHLKRCKAHGVFILPIWPQEQWWPLVVRASVRYCLFPEGVSIFSKWTEGRVIKLPPPAWRVGAWWLDGLNL
jgi:hypothetical protein